MTKPAGELAKTIQIDTILILGYSVNLVTEQGPNIIVTVASGYMNDEDKFVPVERTQRGIIGEDYKAVTTAGANPDEGGIGAALLELLYEEIDKPVPAPALVEGTEPTGDAGSD